MQVYFIYKKEDSCVPSFEMLYILFNFCKQLFHKWLEKVDKHTVCHCKNQCAFAHNAVVHFEKEAECEAGCNVEKVHYDFACAKTDSRPFAHNSAERFRRIVGKTAVFCTGKAKADKYHADCIN